MFSDEVWREQRRLAAFRKEDEIDCGNAGEVVEQGSGAVSSSTVQRVRRFGRKQQGFHAISA